MRTMTIHRFRRARRFLTSRVWIVSAAVLWWGHAPAWAILKPAAGGVQNIRKTPPTTTAQPSPQTPSPKSPAARPGTVPTSQPDESGRRDPFSFRPPQASRCQAS